MEEDISDLTEKVKEYGEISKTIKVTQEKLKVLNKRKKELHKEVIPKLKTTNVTKCNLSFGTLKVTNTQKKILPNKTTMKDRYCSFFSTRALEQDFCESNPEQKAEIMFKYIYVDNVETKQQSNITMVYNKEFKEQLKAINSI